MTAMTARAARKARFLAEIGPALRAAVTMTINPASVTASTTDSHAAHAIGLLAGRRAHSHSTREDGAGFTVTVRF